MIDNFFHDNDNNDDEYNNNDDTDHPYIIEDDSIDYMYERDYFTIDGGDDVYSKYYDYDDVDVDDSDGKDASNDKDASDGKDASDDKDASDGKDASTNKSVTFDTNVSIIDDISFDHVTGGRSSSFDYTTHDKSNKRIISEAIGGEDVSVDIPKSESDVLSIISTIDTDNLSKIYDEKIEEKKLIVDKLHEAQIIEDIDDSKDVVTNISLKKQPKIFVQLLDAKEDIDSIINNETFQYDIAEYNDDISVGDILEFIFDSVKVRRIITKIDNGIAYWSKDE